MKIVITGNSNSGKTTLYNALTKETQHVGNWHGVTVDVKNGVLKGDKTVSIYDLPGLNSFTPFTMEEKVSVDFLKKIDYDLIVNVIEAVRFEASLELTKSLIKLNKPIICLVNMDDDLKKLGGKIDYELANTQGLLFYKCNLTNKADVANLKNLILKERQRFLIKNPFDINFNIIKNSYKAPEKIFTKFDKLLTNTATSLLIFLSGIIISFYQAFGRFGLGKLTADYLLDIINYLKFLTQNFLQSKEVSNFLIGLLCDGILSGIGCLLSFIPPIFILNFFLNYLEQSGIISRFSFVLDKYLCKFGLNGRAIFSLIMGYGCTTVAVFSSKGLENNKIKERLIYSLPFISCSAKVPVYFYIASKFLKGYTVAVIAGMYIIGWFLGLLNCRLNYKLTDKNTVPLILELPIIRINCLKNLVKPLINSVKQFIIKVSTVVVIVSVTIYLLSCLSLDFKYLNSNMLDQSILAWLGKYVVVLLKPINVEDYKIGASLISGLFAKEAILSTLTLLNGEVNLSWSSAIALIVFIGLYPPCLTCLSGIKKELGLLSALYSFAFQMICALLISYSVYLILNFALPALIVLALLIILKLIGNYKNEKLYGTGKRKTFKIFTKGL